MRMTGLPATLIDCCINSCIAYTGSYAELETCPICTHLRWRTNRNGGQTAFQQFVYIPLTPRLQYQYQCRQRAFTMQSYCLPFFERPLNHTLSEINDWWAAQRYRDLRQQGLFNQSTDIALQLLLDGVQLVERGNHSCTPVILINYNLPPALRYQKHNILLSLLIPGPKKYKDIDSFLYPLVEELKELGNGVPAYNSYRREPFNLRAWVVVITGHIIPR
jgi:hypothetical protein